MSIESVNHFTKLSLSIIEWVISCYSPAHDRFHEVALEQHAPLAHHIEEGVFEWIQIHQEPLVKYFTLLYLAHCFEESFVLIDLMISLIYK